MKLRCPCGVTSAYNVGELKHIASLSFRTFHKLVAPYLCKYGIDTLGAQNIVVFLFRLPLSSDWIGYAVCHKEDHRALVWDNLT